MTTTTGFKPTPINLDLDGMFDRAFHMVWHDFLMPLLPNMWPYLLGFAIWVVGGIILQIVMMRAGGHKDRLSPGFNALVGSVTYGIFFGLLLALAYLIWGAQVIDELWFAVIGAISFAATGFFLRLIGFWHY